MNGGASSPIIVRVSRRLRALFAVATLAAASPCGFASARADVITLASGEEIRGRIVSEERGWLAIEVAGGTARVPRSSVIDIVRERPTDYWLEKGDDLLKIGALDEAAAHFRRALEAGARGAAARLATAERLLAERARGAGDLARAEARIAEARRAAARDPGGAREAAEAASRVAAQVAAARERARGALAEGKRLCRERGLEAAVARLREALALDRSLEGEANPWLGRACAEEGERAARSKEYARAAALFDEALRRVPTEGARLSRAVSTCRLGVALERMGAGDPAAAVLSLEAGCAADPASRAARFYLGVAHELCGAADVAAGHYRLALAGTGGVVAGGDDIAPLRAAAALAAAPLPVDPERFLAATRWEGPEKEVPLVASRGKIEVRAHDAARGLAVLEAAERAAREIVAWAGPEAAEVAVVVTVLPTQAAFREVTGSPESVHGVTRARPGDALRSRQVFTFADAADLLDTVVPHEMTHAIAYGRARGVVPLWLNEGLAISSESERARRSRVSAFRRDLAAGKAMPLQEVVRLAGYPESARLDAYYQAAAALTSWLVESHGRGRAVELARRAAAIGLDRACEETLGLADADALAAAFLAAASKETP